MRLARKPAYVAAAAMMLLMSMAAADKPSSKRPKPKRRPVATGVWGGQHIRMEVTATGATLEFDCASGSLPAPLTVDSGGHFRINGAYTAETPGPKREDVAGDTNAVYSGTVTGDRMELTVTVTGAGAREQTYRLTHGQEVRMIKCQ